MSDSNGDSDESASGDEPTEGEPEGERTPPESVLVLFMGGRHEHAITSIQHYVPDAVSIVTSDRFHTQYVRRLNDWSKRYDFRKGIVESVEDLFEPTAVDSLLSCVFEIVKHEHTRKDMHGAPNTSLWKIGLTGGTMHMAAVAMTAANLLDSTAFYVIKPEDGEAVMPNRDIIEFPSLSAMKMVMSLKPNEVSYIEERMEGSLKELHEETDIQPWMMMEMHSRGMVNLDMKNAQWSLTELGFKVFRMLLTGPHFQHLVMEEMKALEKEKNTEVEEPDFYYHG
jgi:hypothetical protein